MLRFLTWPFRWFWRNRKWFAITTGVLMLIAVVTLLVVNPRGVVWGFLLGERFYAGQPVSEWRKEFAAGWEEERLGGFTLVPFFLPDTYGSDATTSSAILSDLLTDPDVNVRRVAASGLRRVGADNPATVGPLATALADADPWVRGLAAEAIGRRGELARDHLPLLLELMNDPDPKVSDRAEAGSWGVDGDHMADKTGWVTHRSERGRYSARFPSRPQVSEPVVVEEGWRQRHERAEVISPDGLFAVEYTDDSMGEPEPDGDDIAPILTKPLVRDYVSTAGLSGFGELRKGEEGNTGLSMQFSGTDVDDHPVVYLSFSRSAADLTSEGDWTAMAIDRSSKKVPSPPAIARMRYFLRSFKPDPRPQAE